MSTKNTNCKFVSEWNDTYGIKHNVLDVIVKRVVRLKSKLERFYKGKPVLWTKLKY